MLKAFAASPVGRRARWLLATLLLLLLVINGLNVVNSYVGRDFITALERRATPVFVRQAVLYVGVFGLSTLVVVLLRFTEETLALTWRGWLTQWAVRRYLKPPVYQRLSDRLIANGEVANPDQRIADDVRAFTTLTLSFLILFLNGTFTILAFSGVMWSISPLLFLVTIGYAAAGSVLAIALGRPLVKLHVAQFDREANFRAELIHVRENAESVAIARREDRLERRLLRRIEDLLANFRRIIAVNRNLGLFATGYSYMNQIVPILIVAPLFIRREVEFGVVTQSAMAFSQLIGAFSLIITQFQSISAYAAVVTRLGVLDEGIEQAQERPVLPSEVCPHHSRTGTCPQCAARPLPASAIEVAACVGDCAVTYDRLTLLSPDDGHVLIRELSGSVSPGTRLLIVGPNDQAKGALFRATAGTWSAGSGRVTRPGDDRMLFLAERPYLPPGTLREVLTTGDETSRFPDERILAVLQELDLGPVLSRVGGLDAERRWDNVLSFEEQQLVACARALLLKPNLVFLERPASALGAQELRRILSLLAANATSVMTIGRTDAALRSYDFILELEEEGQWRWKPIDAQRRE